MDWIDDRPEQADGDGLVFGGDDPVEHGVEGRLVAAMIAFLLGDDLSCTTGSVFDLIRNSPEQFSLPTIATQRIQVRFKRFQWFAAPFPIDSLSLTPKPLVAPWPR